jgi:hypothetical protein
VANDKLAGWVQALGALAALGATAYIAGIEGRRSRRALEAQAALQREIFDHQVRRELAVQNAKRNAALSAVQAAVLLYQQCLSAMLRVNASPQFKAAYEHDVSIAKSIVSNVSYEHLINETDMRLVSGIGVLFGDFDRALDGIITASATDLHSKHFYTYICKAKVMSAMRSLTIMGVDTTGDDLPDELNFTREEKLASENSDGSEWGPDGSVVPDREPRDPNPGSLQLHA